jgi:hypothetical protein
MFTDALLVYLLQSAIQAHIRLNLNSNGARQPIATLCLSEAPRYFAICTGGAARGGRGILVSATRLGSSRAAPSSPSERSF